MDFVHSFLKDYCAINTAQPNPDYRKAVEFLRSHATTDGFAHEVITLSSGLPVFLLTYPGTHPELPALLLNHHMDVVPAPTAGWTSSPFEPTLINNELVARGTQDMKGVAAAHYASLRQLKREGYQPERTIYLLAVPDEERGGFKGTSEFITTQRFKDMNIGMVLDEGMPSSDPHFIYLMIGERKPLQIIVTAQGTQAHASKLFADNPIHDLVDFCFRLTQLHAKSQEAALEQDPGLFLSCNISSMTAGVIENGIPSFNMIPASAQATIDIRVPPTTTIDTITSVLDQVIRACPTVSYTIEAVVRESQQEAKDMRQLYESVSKAIESFNIKVRPKIFEATTDARYYRNQGIAALGLSPFTCQENLHGINESLPLGDLDQGVEIMTSCIRTLCSEES